MTTINEIFRTFGTEYINQFGKTMPSEHKKVINAIIEFRTENAGTAFYKYVCSAGKPI